MARCVYIYCIAIATTRSSLNWLRPYQTPSTCSFSGVSPLPADMLQRVLTVLSFRCGTKYDFAPTRPKYWCVHRICAQTYRSSSTILYTGTFCQVVRIVHNETAATAVQLRDKTPMLAIRTATLRGMMIHEHAVLMVSTSSGLVWEDTVRCRSCGLRQA